MTTRPLQVLVVDDEALAREVAVEYLSRCDDVEVAGQCANGYEAVKAVSDAMPDVLLLDVQMPRLSGFDVLELIGAGPAVIFATAHDEFALRAFEVHAVDYLLKPFSQARLADAINRARERLAARAASPADGLRAALRSMRVERILVRDGGKVFIVPDQSGSARACRARSQGPQGRCPSRRRPPPDQPFRAPTAAGRTRQQLMAGMALGATALPCRLANQASIHVDLQM
jgi:CheY-like chemotaxis protein